MKNWPNPYLTSLRNLDKASLIIRWQLHIIHRVVFLPNESLRLDLFQSQCACFWHMWHVPVIFCLEKASDMSLGCLKAIPIEASDYGKLTFGEDFAKF
jgi:hypothetical protein